MGTQQLFPLKDPEASPRRPLTAIPPQGDLDVSLLRRNRGEFSKTTQNARALTRGKVGRPTLPPTFPKPAITEPELVRSPKTGSGCRPTEFVKRLYELNERLPQTQSRLIFTEVIVIYNAQKGTEVAPKQFVGLGLEPTDS